MTREEFKKHIRNLFYSSKTVEKYLEQAYADIDKIFDEHDLEMKAKDDEIERLKEFEEMVEWMELNSNRSLCDYYNNKDNAWKKQ